MLQSLLPGINGEESSSNRLVTWRALGGYAKLIHFVGLDGFGETLAGFRAGHAQAEGFRSARMARVFQSFYGGTAVALAAIALLAVALAHG
jgi:hypothetical protein